MVSTIISNHVKIELDHITAKKTFIKIITMLSTEAKNPAITGMNIEAMFA